MNPRSGRLALYAIGAIAILASANALAHSYAGLYDWAVHHRLGGWQAKSWPAEIDVFLAVGELALYIAYLDGWPARQRIWPWVTALIGLMVSVAGNIAFPLRNAGVGKSEATERARKAAERVGIAALLDGVALLYCPELPRRLVAWITKQDALALADRPRPEIRQMVGESGQSVAPR